MIPTITWQETFDSAVDAVQNLVLQPAERDSVERALNALSALKAQVRDSVYHEVDRAATQLSKAVGATQSERFVPLLFELREAGERQIEAERERRPPGPLRYDLGADRERLLQVSETDRHTIERALGRGDTLYEAYIEGVPADLDLVERIEQQFSVVRSTLLRGAERAGFLIVAATEPDLTALGFGPEVTVRSNALDPEIVLGGQSLLERFHGGGEPVQLSAHHAALERAWFYLRQAQRHGDERQRDLLLELERALRSATTVALKDLLSDMLPTFRDLAAEQRKRVRISMTGYPAGIHAEAAATLRGILRELIVNAITHGIEVPSDRRTSGKPEEGSVIVSAVQEADGLQIVVTDDGRGPEASDRFERDDEGNARLAVRSLGNAERLMAERLGGTLRFETGKNGTRVSLVLPALNDVHRALIFAHGGVPYALPAALVVAGETLNPEDLVFDASNWPFVRRGDALLRVVAADGKRPPATIHTYLVVETSRTSFAMAADGLPYSAVVTRSFPGRVRIVDSDMDDIEVPALTDLVF